MSLAVYLTKIPYDAVLGYWTKGQCL